MAEQNEQHGITVLNVVPDERFGGPQNRVLQVAKRLKEKGIETIVVIPRGDETFAHLLEDAGIPFFQLSSFRRLPNPSNLPGIVLWLCYFLPCMHSIFRLIRKQGINIVHVNGALNVQVSLAARLAGAKLLWHLNDVRRS
ncbi:MAG: glycosyltransferase, partial [Dehalococcoidia bacterium]